MGESIAQSVFVHTREALLRVLAGVEAALREAGAALTEPGAAAALDDFARLAGSVRVTDLRLDRAAPRERLPVCRFWDAALQATSGPTRPLTEALGVLAPWLSWTQNPNYRERPPSASFLDNYGYAVMAGPSEGPPALVLEARFALGVLLLGPRVHYPLHAHPAVEIYDTLTSGEWWRDSGPWRQRPAGVAIHHAPHVRHAMRAGASPLLAIYLWRGDLATHARLI